MSNNLGGALQGKQAHSLHKPLGSAPQSSAPTQKPVATRPAVQKNQVKQTKSGLNFNITQTEAEIRRDYIYEEYAIIAPKRHDRPFDFRGNDHPLIETASSPHLDDQKTLDELKSPLGGWPVKVVENKFPAISLKTPKAYGEQELVVDTPLSNLPPGRLSVESMQDVLRVYQRRIRKLSSLEHIKYVQVFKNDGHHAGASLAHAHTQVFALPLVPPRYLARAQAVEEYWGEKHSDPFEDIIRFEQKEATRIISNSDQLLCFAPYASGWPLEAWILPKRNVQSFADCNEAEIKEIANTLLNLLRKLNGSGINYNFYIEQGLGEHQRWVLKVIGREVVSPLGGLEVSTGIMINTIPPEAAAAWYKTP